MVPFSIYEYKNNPELFNWENFVYATASMGLVMVGISFFSKSLEWGPAGPLQAIESCKTVVQTILVIVLLSQIPNAMQTVGLLLALVGVCVIVLQKKKK